jgi:aspartate aminotransferase-like enzyme
LLCTAFNVRETFVLTGSGTLANEAMLQQVKYISGSGIILSNGEFGSRLIEQSRRNNINFVAYKLEWGKTFDLEEIEKTIKHHSAKWILFCHCETSTGVINDLNEITALANLYKCMCFVDCMSTVGTMPIDLSKVSMATASSGKGLACIPGLAIIFSNIQLSLNRRTPVYLDLAHYSAHSGVPFTVSSNLLKGLYISIRQKLNEGQFELMQQYGGQIFKILKEHDLVPFSHWHTKVFTIATAGIKNKKFIEEVRGRGVGLSYESDYLKSRRWCQLATFGYYKERQLKYVISSLNKTLWHK